MKTPLLYLTEVSACMALLYAIYYILLRRTTFFSWNRAYLILLIFASGSIPLFSYETTQTVEIQPSNQVTLASSFDNSTGSDVQENTVNFPVIANEQNFEKPFDWSQFLFFGYLLGICTMAVLFLYKISKIIQIIRTSERLHWLNDNQIRLLKTEHPIANSSFFRNIFVDIRGLSDTEIEQLIQHEYWHFRLKHSFDIVFIEIMKIVFWFNPVIYFLKKSLLEIHEYQVDEKVTANFNKNEYAHLLLKLAIPQNASFTNQFSTQPLKSRIIFLFTKRSHTMKKLFYLSMIPMVAIGLLAFAKEEIRIIYLKVENTYSAPKKTTINVFGWKYNSYPNDKSGFKKNRAVLIQQKNINQLEFKNVNDFDYYLSPNVLSETVIDEVNEYTKLKGIELLYASENGNVRIDLKNTRTKEKILGKSYSLNWLKNQTNGYFLINASVDKWEKSGIIFYHSDGQMQISDATNFAISYLKNPETANISIDKYKIRAFLCPDIITYENLDKVAENFKKHQFQIDYKLKVRLHEIIDMNVTIHDERKDNQAQGQFNLNDLRHKIKLKNDSKSTFNRVDETIVFEGNLITREVKIYVENRWFNGIRKSGKFDIIDFSSFTSKKDSSNSNFQNYLGVKPQHFGNFSVNKILPRTEKVSFTVFQNDLSENREKFISIRIPTDIEPSSIKVTAGGLELQPEIEYFIENGLVNIYETVIKRAGQPVSISFEKSPYMRIKVQKNLDNHKYNNLITNLKPPKSLEFSFPTIENESQKFNSETYKIELPLDSKLISCKIYNRFGKLIYSDETSKLLKGENESFYVWDGKPNQRKVEDLPNGTYFYVIEYVLNGVNSRKTNYITISKMP